MANVLASNELRKGTVYLDSNEVLRVLDYQHKKYGRGQATIKVKVKNIHTGSISEKTYDSGAKLEQADTSKRNVQYLYQDGSSAYFMDSSDYSQFELSVTEIEHELRFLKEAETVVALFLDSKAVGIEIPKTVTLTVTKAVDAVAGDSATNATKKVTVETGAEIDVPLFVKQGDSLKINTESSTYVSRA